MLWNRSVYHIPFGAQKFGLGVLGWYLLLDNTWKFSVGIGGFEKYLFGKSQHLDHRTNKNGKAGPERSVFFNLEYGMNIYPKTWHGTMWGRGGKVPRTERKGILEKDRNRVGVGMLRGAGDSLTWKGLLVSWFIGFLVYWLLVFGIRYSKFQISWSTRRAPCFGRKTEFFDVFFLMGVANRPKSIKLVWKIFTFWGGSNANEFY